MKISKLINYSTNMCWNCQGTSVSVSRGCSKPEYHNFPIFFQLTKFHEFCTGSLVSSLFPLSFDYYITYKVYAPLYFQYLSMARSPLSLISLRITFNFDFNCYFIFIWKKRWPFLHYNCWEPTQGFIICIYLLFKK